MQSGVPGNGNPTDADPTLRVLPVRCLHLDPPSSGRLERDIFCRQPTHFGNSTRAADVPFGPGSTGAMRLRGRVASRASAKKRGDALTGRRRFFTWLALWPRRWPVRSRPANRSPEAPSPTQPRSRPSKTSVPSPRDRPDPASSDRPPARSRTSTVYRAPHRATSPPRPSKTTPPASSRPALLPVSPSSPTTSTSTRADAAAGPTIVMANDGFAVSIMVTTIWSGRWSARAPASASAPSPRPPIRWRRYGAAGRPGAAVQQRAAELSGPELGCDQPVGGGFGDRRQTAHRSVGPEIHARPGRRDCSR